MNPGNRLGHFRGIFLSVWRRCKLFRTEGASAPSLLLLLLPAVVSPAWPLPLPRAPREELLPLEPERSAGGGGATGERAPPSVTEVRLAAAGNTVVWSNHIHATGNAHKEPLPPIIARITPSSSFAARRRYRYIILARRRAASRGVAHKMAAEK